MEGRRISMSSFTVRVDKEMLGKKIRNLGYMRRKQTFFDQEIVSEFKVKWVEKLGTFVKKITVWVREHEFGVNSTVTHQFF